MSRTKKFFYNSLSAAILQVVTMIAGFITPRVILQFYGSEINGLVTSISQFIAYFNLVEMGLSGAVIYALYEPLAVGNHKAINSVVSAAKKYYLQAGYIFFILIVGLAVIYPLLLNTEVINSLDMGLLILILGCNGALEFFTLAKYRTLLTADQRMYVISIATMISIALNTLIIVVLANFKVNIVLLRLIALLSVFVRSAILTIYVKIKYKYIYYKENPNIAALNKRWDALYLQILGIIQTGAPIVIITFLLRDLKIISVYSVFNMVIGGVSGIFGIFMSGLSASFGDVLARKELKTLQSSYMVFEFFYYSMVTVVYSVALVTIMPFIRIYTRGITDTNYELTLVGILFVLNGLLFNIKTPQGMMVISAGMFKETKWQTTIQGAIVVLLGIVLALFFGLTGILIAAMASNLYRDIDLLFFVARKVTLLPVRNSFFRIIRIFCCSALIWLPFFFIKLNPTSYHSWFIDVFGVSLYAFSIVFIFGLLFDRKEMKRVLTKIMVMAGEKSGKVV